MLERVTDRWHVFGVEVDRSIELPFVVAFFQVITRGQVWNAFGAKVNGVVQLEFGTEFVFVHDPWVSWCWRLASVGDFRSLYLRLERLSPRASLEKMRWKAKGRIWEGYMLGAIIVAVKRLSR